MKKKKIFLIVMFLMLSTFGCAKAKITYKIDDKFNTSITYYVIVDKNILPEQQHVSVHTIITTTSSAYEKKGFVIEHYQNDNDKIELKMSLTKANQSLDEAYQTLEELMIDPSITFLTSVDQDYKVLEYDSTLKLEVQTDIPLILEGSGFIKLPKMTQDEVLSSINESDLQIEFILPSSTIINRNEQTMIKQDKGQTIISTPILIDQKTILNVQLRTSLNNNKPLNLTITDSIDKSNTAQTTYQIMGYASGALAILTLVLIIRQKRKV
ncbi:MAG: hypothetical protein VB009_05285 [Erysipelotrichaceae bacterium]|nr:hypothetical protein [Erysipelotrichaceae bacterium]